MIRTACLISKLTEVPREWVFEHYLNIGESLNGQDVKMKSVFNTTDKTPSMYIFADKNKVYRFKDFSSGKGGDGVTLVHELFNLSSRGEAAHKIIEDYNQQNLTGRKDYSLQEFKQQARYKITSYTKRSWTTNDKAYWGKYKIGSKLLEKYCVVPLAEYLLTKNDEGEITELIISGSFIYGYFKQDGTLYKIYQPMVKKNKFLKIHPYIQGSEQLTYEKPYLLISSSMKDLLDFNVLGLTNVESVAPDSENTLIPENIILKYKQKYKAICTLFDYDKAGKDASLKYLEKYGISFIELPLEKDLSDSIEKHGVEEIRNHMIPLLRKTLTDEPIGLTL
jgi:hypothetical protein